MAATGHGRTGIVARWLRGLAPRKSSEHTPRWLSRRSPPPFPGLIALEDRTLLSATPVDAELLAAMAFRNAAAPAPATDQLAIVSEPRSLETSSQSVVRREVAFIDSSVANARQLADDLLQNAGPARQLDIVFLKPGVNGIEQISDALAGYVHLDAVHIFSHGTEGAIKLGDQWVNADELNTHARDVREWSSALGAKAGILLYGCDVAGDTAGRQFVDQLARLTGANVAASADDTGANALGGDWELEYQVGLVDASSLRALEAQAWNGLLNVFTVTNTADSGAGSLRQAILDANALAGADTIGFNIAGSGPHTIDLFSLLPNITDTVILDGTTQPGFAGRPLIELNGAAAGAGHGLVLDASNSTIRGFIVNRFVNDGIVVRGTGNTIAGNWVGLDVTGSIDLGNGEDGINIRNSNNTIGGTGSQDRNVVSGNDDEGIDVDPGAVGTIIHGNYVGTDVSGMFAVPNGVPVGSDSGGLVIQGSGTIIGGVNPGEGNLISGNYQRGLHVYGDNTTILGNLIGTDAAGTGSLGNQGIGIEVRVGSAGNVIGGTAAGQGNTIAFNGSDGVRLSVFAGSSNSVRGNQIHSNGGLGINLVGGTEDAAGVTANDAGDPDGGTNGLQNFPVLTTAATNGAALTVTGSIDTTPSAIFTLDFYSSDSPDGSGHGEGQTYLGSAVVTTDAAGVALFNITLPTAVASGATISATATNAGNSTSEFGFIMPAAGFVISPSAGLVTTEAGGTATFDVTLATAPTGDVTLALSSSNTNEGTLSTTGLTFTPGNWNLAQTVTITGVQDFINDGNVAYLVVTAPAVSSDANYSGLDAVNVAVTNNAVPNAAPIHVLPESQATLTNVPLVFSPANGNAITITDTDAGSATVRVTLSVDRGVLTLSRTTGLTFTSGDGISDATMVFRGTLANINGALDGLTYTPPNNFAGAANLAITTNDLGNSGLGGPKQTSTGLVIEMVFDLRANTTISGIQRTFPESPQAVAADANGNFVIVWGDSAQDGSGYGVYARRFSASGAPLGGEFRVNVTTAGVQSFPTIAMDALGNFVVTWSSDADGDGNAEIYARRYDPSGAALSGEILVSTTPGINHDWPTIALGASGNFVVAWTIGAGSADPGVRAQRFDAAGMRLGGQIQVNTTTAFSQHFATVAMDAAGNFVVTWSSVNQDGSGHGVYAQRFDSSGALVGGEILVNTTTVGDQFHSAIAMDAAGNFVVTWTSDNQDGDRFGVYGQRFDVSGSPLGSEFLVNTMTIRDQASSAVAMDLDGNFVVTWTSRFQDNGDKDGVFAQRFDANGVSQGPEFQVNSTVREEQHYSSVAVANGQIIIAWSGKGPGDGTGVFYQLFDDGYNDAPTQTVPAAQTSPEDTPLVFSLANGNRISASDPDAGANSVQITLSATNGTLTLGGTAGLSFLVGDGSGDATMVFTGSLINVNAALDGLAFDPAGNYFGPATLTFMTDDQGNTGFGGPRSAMSNLSILVTSINDAPVAVNDSFAATEDAPLTIAVPGVLANDTDVEGDSLSAVLVTGPANGSLTFNPDGSFTYTPRPDFFGSDSFTYRISDGAALSNIATVTITVSGVADLPRAADDRPALAFDGGDDFVNFGGSPLFRMNSTLTMEAWVNPDASTNVNQMILNKEGEYELAIFPDRSLQLAFGNGGAWTWYDTGYSVQPGTWTHLAVAFDNGVISTYANGILVDTAVHGSATIGDAHPLLNDLLVGGRSNLPAGKYFDGRIADVRLWNSARSGAEIAADQTTTLTGAEAGLVGYWTFDELAGTTALDRTANGNDGQLGGGAPGQRPAWYGFRTDEDTPLSATTVLANDYDADGDLLIATLVSGPPNAAAFLLNPDGTFSYTPSLDFVGVDSFRYRISDGAGFSNIATAFIRVDPINDAPVANDDNYAIAEDSPLVVNLPGLLANDADVEGDPLTAAIVLGPSNGALSLNSDGSFTYTPSANFFGTDTFTYRANDGSADSNIATVTITVGAVNDSPTLVNAQLTLNEGQAVTLTPAELASTDVDNGPAQLRYFIRNLSGGRFETTFNLGVAITDFTQAEVDAGFIRFVNDGGEATPAYDVTVSDAALSAGPRPVSVSFTNVNDAPALAVNQLTLSEGQSVILTAANLSSTDADNGPTQRIYSISNLVRGRFEYAGAPGVAITSFTQAEVNAGQVRFLHDGSEMAPGYDVTVSDSALSDGPRPASITFANLNNAPVLTVPGRQTVAEDGVLALPAITISDVDAGASPIQMSLSAANGRFSLTTRTGLTFSSGDGISDQVMTFRGSSADVNLALRSVSYRPDANFNGLDRVSVLVNDLGNTGAGGSSTASDEVLIRITAVNDAPTANDGALGAAEDTVLSSAGAGVLGMASDIDSTSLSAVLVTGPTNGTLTLSPDGTFNYAPNLNYYGTDQFVYRVHDGSADSNDATVTLTVDAVNQPPQVPLFAPSALGTIRRAGDVVGFVAGSDVDIGDSVTFDLVSYSGGAFTINPRTGEVRVADPAALRAAPQGEIIMVVRVTDSRGASASSVQTLRLSQENPLLFVSFSAGFTSGAAAGAAAATGPAAGNSRSDRDAAFLVFAPSESAASLHLGDLGTAAAPTQANQPQAAPSSFFAMIGQQGLALDVGAAFALRGASSPLTRGLAEWASADELIAASGARTEQRTIGRAALPIQFYDRMEDELQEMARAFQPDDWTRSMVVTLTTGLSVGYVALSLRHLYLLASVLLSRPLWNSIDPLNVLDSWTTEEGRLLLGGADDDNEDDLEPVLGNGVAGRKA